MKARSKKLLQSLPFFFPQSPHPDYHGVSAKGRKEPKREASKGKKALANRLLLDSSTLEQLHSHYPIPFLVMQLFFLLLSPPPPPPPPPPPLLSPIVFSNPSPLYQPETQVSVFVVRSSLQNTIKTSKR